MSESSARQSAILGQQPPTASAPRMRLAPRDPAALPPDDSSRRVDTPKPLLRTLAWILRLCAIVLVLMAAIIVFTHLDGGESELVAALVGVAGLIAAATVWTIGEIAAFLALQR